MSNNKPKKPRKKYIEATYDEREVLVLESPSRSGDVWVYGGLYPNAQQLRSIAKWATRAADWLEIQNSE